MDPEKESRKRLASLPFSDKIRILEKLRDRDRAIAASGLRKKRTVRRSIVRVSRAAWHTQRPCDPSRDCTCGLHSLAMRLQTMGVRRYGSHGFAMHQPALALALCS